MFNRGLVSLILEFKLITKKIFFSFLQRGLSLRIFLSITRHFYLNNFKSSIKKNLKFIG